MDNTNGWLKHLLNRRHANIAAVALADKNVPTVWALLAHGREFKVDYAPSNFKETCFILPVPLSA